MLLLLRMYRILITKQRNQALICFYAVATDLQHFICYLLIAFFVKLTVLCTTFVLIYKEFSLL